MMPAPQPVPAQAWGQPPAAPAGGYGVPPAGGYSAPPAGGFGAPPAGGYGAPAAPAGGYGAPPGYGAGYGASASYAPAAGYAPGYYPPAPQPPKSGMSRSTMMLIGFVLVPLVIITLIVLVKAFSTPVVTPPIDVTPTRPSTSATTPGGGETTAPPGAEYKNDDYQVPEPDPNPPKLPMPDTYGEANDWLENNAIYNGQVPSPVRCEVTQVPPTASKGELSKYLNEVSACLMRVWANELNAAGFNATRPTVHVYSGSGQSACGKLSPGNAYYCSADQQIYYAQDIYTLMPQFKNDTILPLEVIAHEFGHGIQGMTGILRSEGAWEYQYEEDGNKDAAMKISRRLEFQADCFAGPFIGAVSQSIGLTEEQYQTLLGIGIALGDDTLTGDPNFVGDHGRGYNRQAWMMTGYKNGPLGTCNSFDPTIPSEDLA